MWVRMQESCNHFSANSFLYIYFLAGLFHNFGYLIAIMSWFSKRTFSWTLLQFIQTLLRFIRTLLQFIGGIPGTITESLPSCGSFLLLPPFSAWLFFEVSSFSSEEEGVYIRNRHPVMFCLNWQFETVTWQIMRTLLSTCIQQWGHVSCYPRRTCSGCMFYVVMEWSGPPVVWTDTRLWLLEAFFTLPPTSKDQPSFPALRYQWGGLSFPRFLLPKACWWLARGLHTLSPGFQLDSPCCQSCGGKEAAPWLEPQD